MRLEVSARRVKEEKEEREFNRIPEANFMETKLVYLRPQQVVCHREFGPFRESGPKAWDYVLSWLDRHGIRDEVTRGFGLARTDPNAKDLDKSLYYEACIELPPSFPLSNLEKMQFQSLPGGAYARQRYKGNFDGIPTASRNLRETWKAKHGLCADLTRPLVEIYLDDAKKVSSENLRVDLCMPIAIDEISNVA